MATSKEEYLKRYLDTDQPKKRKRKIQKAQPSRMKIVEDDIDLNTMNPQGSKDAHEDDVYSDDEPTVAQVIDDRPEHMKEKDSRWKPVPQTAKEKSSSKPLVRSAKNGALAGRGRKPVAKQTQMLPFKRMRHDSNSSGSMHHDSDGSSPRRGCHDSDESPQGRGRHDSDESPPRNLRHDSDESPPRNLRHDSDESPPRKGRHDSDVSPQKSTLLRRKVRVEPMDNQRENHMKKLPLKQSRPAPQAANIKRKTVVQKSGLTRKGRRSPSHSSSDAGSGDRPLPKSRRIPARREPFDDGDSDFSPPRQLQRRTADPRRSITPTPDFNDEHSNGFMGVELGSEPVAMMKKTLSGAKAGLSTAKEVKAELMRKRREDDAFMASMDPEDLGRGAKTTVRKSKRPKELTKEEQRAQAQKEEQERVTKQKYEEWGKGVKQVANQSKRLAEDIYEMTKPLARYHGDEDLERDLRSAVHTEEDPMADYILKKRKRRDRGSSDQEGKPERPRYQGKAPPPNRFGIEPGYRWDGVDRSTGFESRIVQEANKRKAHKSDAYKWSVEDM